jgi:hypothetical protein
VVIWNILWFFGNFFPVLVRKIWQLCIDICVVQEKKKMEENEFAREKKEEKSEKLGEQFF